MNIRMHDHIYVLAYIIYYVEIAYMHIHLDICYCMSFLHVCRYDSMHIFVLVYVLVHECSRNCMKACLLIVLSLPFYSF